MPHGCIKKENNRVTHINEALKLILVRAAMIDIFAASNIRRSSLSRITGSTRSLAI